MNGDGIDDLIVSATYYDNALVGDGTETDHGVVYVFYGNASIAGSSVNTSSADIKILGDQANSSLGASVDCADFNGDGIDDILMGSEYYDDPARSPSTNHGAAMLIFGSSSFPADHTINLTTTDPDLVVYGEASGDRLGQSLAHGDIDGDGIEDIIIGAPWADNPGINANHGVTYVIYGRTSFTVDSIDLSDVAADITIYGKDGTDLASTGLASGDVNGDGFDDILIGSPNGNGTDGTDSKRGETYVVYGDDALGANYTLDMSGTHPDIRLYGQGSEDYAGGALASGDINRDGIDDIIIGAYGGGTNDSTDEGRVYVIYGKTDFANQYSATLSSNPGAAGYSILGDDHDDFTGWKIRAADINGDGYDDLLIGTINGDNGAATGFDHGEVSIIYGAAGLTGGRDLTSSAPDVRIYGDDASDFLGYVLGSGDLNGDGFADVITGTPYADPVSSAEGEIYLILGDGTASSATRKETEASGDAPESDFGPVVRARIDYAAGSASSVTTVAVTRDNGGISGLGSGGLAEVADVVWEISTDRNSFTSAEVSFQYSDTEISGQTESDLELYKASALSGPWSLVSSQTINTDLNLISGTVTSFSYFALVDLTEPEVVSTTPVGGATNVSAGSTVRAVFSETLESSTVTSSTFTLNNGVTGTVSFSGVTATFTPSASLAFDTTYTATLTTGLEDRSGNAMASAHTWSFTTAGEDSGDEDENTDDGQAPSVSSVSPASGATDVPVDAEITATFDRAMDDATVTADYVLLDDESVDFDLSYSEMTLTLTPASPLAHGTTYTVTLTTGLEDVEGTPLSEDYSWSFTTAEEESTTSGQGGSSSGAAASGGCSLNPR